MADVYGYEIRFRVELATHDTVNACRRELRQAVQEMLRERFAQRNAGPTGAIDSIMSRSTVKIKSVEELEREEVYR